MPTMNVDHGTIKLFQYDTPNRRNTRLFQLDLNGENEPLSGKLISFIDTSVALGNFDLRGYLQSFSQDDWGVLKKLSGSEKYDALSWVWGPSESKQLLYLTTIGSSLDENGDPDLDQGRDRNGYIHILPPLYEFLKEYRRRQCRRFLWM
jgi:hypothetical protein